MSLYEYNAVVLRIVDGDTVHLQIDLGLDSFRNIKCRLAGINAPEMETQEGKDARTYLMDVLPEEVIVHTVKDHTEKYGRYLVWIWPISEKVFDKATSFNYQMVDTGHAVVYNGGLRS